MSGTDGSVRAGQLTRLTPLCAAVEIVSSAKNGNRWKCLHEICITSAKYLQLDVFEQTVFDQLLFTSSRCGNVLSRPANTEELLNARAREQLLWD